MGAVGFNPLPALRTGDPEEDSGNYLLLDNIAALKWVQRNIEAFGGDAGNVTISGLSAGGGSVFVMIMSPLAKGLFHRAITFSRGLVAANPQAARKVYAERVINLFPLASARLGAFPSCFTDGCVLPENPFDNPDMNHVPLMALYSSDEFSSFVGVDPWFRKRQKAETPDETLNADKDFCTKYGSLIFGYFNSHKAAEKLYPYLGGSIYVGKFRYGHEAKHFSEEFTRRYGAAHGVFLPFLSDQYKMPWKRGNDFFEHIGAEYLGAQFFDYIGMFMESGDPNYSAEDTPWHAWPPEMHRELIFDGDRKRGYVTAGVNRFSFDDLFAQFDADTSASEESKSVIAHQVLRGRWFSAEWDSHFGNAPDPTLIK